MRTPRCEVFDVPLGDILFVGDSLRADVMPAKAMGFDTVWINAEEKSHPMADYVVSSLLGLECLQAELDH